MFSWMNKKLSGKQKTDKQNFVSATNHKLHESCKEEFIDWPEELLAIGTLGINNLKNPEKSCPEGSINDPDVFEASAGFDILQERLSVSTQSSKDEAKCDNLAIGEVVSGLARRRGVDISLDKTNLGIEKKSLSFLLKKTFICGGEFSTSPPPVIKDPFPKPKLETSRMKKLLRGLVHKRFYPRSPSPRGAIKKYLSNKTVPETDSNDEASEKANDGCKWVKTDSEYIVLEI